MFKFLVFRRLEISFQPVEINVKICIDWGVLSDITVVVSVFVLSQLETILLLLYRV